ncbi:DUF6415 family natural product biosynthesis protein [Streptomyces sp. 3214.6]|uniref:DUF6415 family natural product biosynthesis protein n=1 Tax=Streptomyces sp. 3214.6 TaxID=1882757 RepID=UPI00090AE264|nr:DUF6415 family natural product biosynthesis protein [Streptomyces sp. 3214.6]SHI69194.1 hypothetical protein SAMN05444521_8252 [Streptomyces sp. 3214.6]
MTNSTTRAPAVAAPPLADPPDIATMRETARILLDPDAIALAPAGPELATLTRTVRGHLELLIPMVERAAGSLERESARRYCALACLGEARGKLRAEPSRASDGALLHARKLARVLNALCDHYEKSGGERP